jgi:hypothetical protein
MMESMHNEHSSRSYSLFVCSGWKEREKERNREFVDTCAPIVKKERKTL